jgi:hypothetical protein
MPEKSGFCVYFFAHRGVGRTIQESKDYKSLEKQLKAGQPGNETYNIACDSDKKKAIKKYNNLLKKEKEKRQKAKTKKGGRTRTKKDGRTIKNNKEQ